MKTWGLPYEEQDRAVSRESDKVQGTERDGDPVVKGCQAWDALQEESGRLIEGATEFPRGMRVVLHLGSHMSYT